MQIRIESRPAAGAGRNAEVFLAITEDDLQSNVTRGENAGRRRRHAAVVRSLTPIGNLHRRPNENFVTDPVVTILEGWDRQNLHAVVLVQENKTRRVLGAATMDLAARE